eukprot:5636634-Amphidinium_carterae.1
MQIRPALLQYVVGLELERRHETQYTLEEMTPRHNLTGIVREQSCSSTEVRTAMPFKCNADMTRASQQDKHLEICSRVTHFEPMGPKEEDVIELLSAMGLGLVGGPQSSRRSGLSKQGSYLACEFCFSEELGSLVYEKLLSPLQDFLSRTTTGCLWMAS